MGRCGLLLPSLPRQGKAAAKGSFTGRKAAQVPRLVGEHCLKPHSLVMTHHSRESGGMADALASGASARKGVGVQLPPLAFRFLRKVTDSAALSSEFGVTADSPEQDAEPRSLPPGARANNDPGRVLLPEKPRSSPWNRDESREINAKQSARPPSERPRHDSSTGAASTRLIATSTRKPRMQTRPCSYRAAQHANDLPNYNSKYVGHLWGDGRAADCTQAEWEEVVAVASQAGISSLDGQFFGALPVRHPRLGL